LDRWRAEKPFGFDIPSRARKHPVPRRRERRKIGERGACYERAARRRWQVQHIEQPA
jgi:hypothetical protein